MSGKKPGSWLSVAMGVLLVAICVSLWFYIVYAAIDLLAMGVASVTGAQNTGIGFCPQDSGTPGGGLRLQLMLSKSMR